MTSSPCLKRAVRRLLDDTRQVDAGDERKPERDLRLAARGERVLVVDAGVGHAHDDVAGIQLVARHGVEAACAELAASVNAISLHTTVTPPSATMTWPVMNAAASEARNTAMPPMSRGTPSRRSGVCASRALRRVSSSHSALAKSVLIRPGRDGVHAHVLRPPLGGEVAHQVVVGRLRHAVGADHRVGPDAADRAHGDEAAAAALGHAGQRDARQPQHALHVVQHHLVEGLVRNLGQRPVVRVRRRVRDRDVDAAPLGDGLVHQRLQLLLARDIAGLRQHFEALLFEFGAHRVAGLGLAARNDDLAAGARQLLGHRLADARASSR